MPCAAATERVGLVLAGGRAGANWPWRHGMSLREQAERILQRAGVGTVLISGIEDCANAIPDRVEGLGPLGGLRTALDHPGLAAGATLIITAFDMPALSPRALARLADIAEFDGRGALFDLGPLPMALRTGPELQAAVDATLSTEASLAALAAGLQLPVVASLPDDGLDHAASLEELNELRRRLETAGSTP